MEKYSIPSKCFSSEDKSINNPNFHPVKIRIMSSGKNWNGSDFAINSLDMAKDTVAYAPILANVVTREDGEIDANGHDTEWELKCDYNGNMTYKETYIEKPVGVFLANACEKRYDVDNDVYYLESYGYIWKEYSEIYDILKRDEVKDVSVEISVDDGEFREDGYYEIRKFNVLGCTILGNGCLPAIDNSRIEFNFSLNNNKEYDDKVKELDELLKTFTLKGGDDVEEKNIVGEFEEEVVIEESQVQEFAEEEKEDDVCPECGKNPCECEEDDKEECQKEDEEETQEEEEKEEKIYSQSEMDEAIANAKAEFTQAMEELEVLRQFKADYDKALEVQELNEEMDNLVSQFSCDDELVKELREKVLNKEITMDAFELQLWRNNKKVAKKEFSKETQSNKLPVMDNEKEISEVDKLFASYGIYKK